MSSQRLTAANVMENYSLVLREAKQFADICQVFAGTRSLTGLRA